MRKDRAALTPKLWGNAGPSLPLDLALLPEVIGCMQPQVGAGPNASLTLIDRRSNARDRWV